MFVRGAIIALAVAAVFSSNVEAQLFRFGRNYNNSSRFANPPQQQPASGYDASAYRYTNPSQRAAYIPSQRSNYQSPCERPPCPADSNRQFANQADAQPQQTGTDQQNQIMVVTYRDPYTGRTFQRQYSVRGPAQPGKTPASQKADAVAQKARSLEPKADSAGQLSQASQIGVEKATALDAADGIRRTSFEGPVLTPPDSSPEFSVLEVDGAKSVIESSMPILEPQESNSLDPGTLELNPTESIDIDLPALKSEDGN